MVRDPKVMKERRGRKFNTFGFQVSPSDFVIIAPSFSALSTSLRAATLKVGKAYPELLTTAPKIDKAGNRVLTKDNKQVYIPVRNFDIGHVGAGRYAERNTPALKFLEQGMALLSKFGDTKVSLRALKRASKEIKKEHSKYKASHSTKYSKNSSMKELSGQFEFVYTIPQSKRLNNLLAVVEAKSAKLLSDKLSKLRGSKSLDEQLDLIIHAAVQSKKFASKKVTTKASGTLKRTKGKQKLTVKQIPKRTKRKAPVRSKAGPSAIQLMNLINLSLTEQVKENMERPFLRNQTGRFAESVKIQNATQGKAGLTTFYYDYAKAPYQTFENSSRWPSGYDPRPLISLSIRDVASQLMQTKFRSVRL